MVDRVRNRIETEWSGEQDNSQSMGGRFNSGVYPVEKLPNAFIANDLIDTINYDKYGDLGRRGAAQEVLGKSSLVGARSES